MADLEQPWSQSWYPTMMADLAKISGWGAPGSDGQDMPNLSAIDTVAVLGVVTPSLVSAIVRFNTQANGGTAGNVAAPSSVVADDGKVEEKDIRGDTTSVVGMHGVVTVPSSTNTNTGSFIDVNTYLQYQPIDDGASGGKPWERFANFIDGYQVWYSNTFIAHGYPEILSLVRQAIADWQRMVNASASCINTAAANVASPADQESLSEFMSALRALCADFDVLNESPARVGHIADAIRDAVAKTSEFVGKAAADVASEVGKQAGIIGGNLTGGFLENAGVLSIIVVGIVVHLFLAR